MENTPYLEALRYVDNARKILSKHAGKSGDYYSDPKYVKMACNTAYTGILVALDATLNLERKKGVRLDVNVYKKALASQNKKILNDFVSAYNYLHLFGGYDGDLNVATSQKGLELAQRVIEWSKPVSHKMSA